MKYKSLLACILLVLIAILGTHLLTKRYDRRLVGYKLLLNSQTINNKKVKTLIDSNKPLLVHFWGTWCPNCIKELDEIEKLSKNRDLILITVAQNSGSNKALKEFMKKRGLTFNVVNDKNNDLVTAFKILGYPTTYYYSPNRYQTVLKRAGTLKYNEYLFFVDFVNKY